MPRSIPIFLDRLHHIRFDLNSMWDIEYLVPGGFEGIFKREWETDAFEVIRLLLWLGFQHEEKLSLSDVGYIFQYSIDNGKIKHIEAYKACSDALHQAGWLLNPDEMQHPRAKGTANNSIKDRILDIEKAAIDFLHLSPIEIWKLTPCEIELMINGAILQYELNSGNKIIKPTPKVQSPEEVQKTLQSLFGGM